MEDEEASAMVKSVSSATTAMEMDSNNSELVRLDALHSILELWNMAWRFVSDRVGQAVQAFNIHFPTMVQGWQRLKHVALAFMFRRWNEWAKPKACIGSEQTNRHRLLYPNPDTLNCQTLMDVRDMEMEDGDIGGLYNTDIKQRWQLYQSPPPEDDDHHFSSPNMQQFKQSKPIICSRSLHLSDRNRSKSRQSNRDKEVPCLTEDDDLLFDSASMITESVTIASTAQQAKIGEMESQLQLLQKQMQLLMNQQQNPSLPSCSTSSKGCLPPSSAAVEPIPPAPIPPPPPPPLPPAFTKPSLTSKIASNAEKIDKPQPSTSSKPPAMQDILKDLGNVKLRKVNRSPESSSVKPKKDLNDGTLVGALVHALGERRKKLKLDSDGEESKENAADEDDEAWRDEENAAIYS